MAAVTDKAIVKRPPRVPAKAVDVSLAEKTAAERKFNPFDALIDIATDPLTPVEQRRLASADYARYLGSQKKPAEERTKDGNHFTINFNLPPEIARAIAFKRAAPAIVDADPGE